MNPSRVFILRPTGTALLMVALLLVGLVAYRFLPISALPEVSYPTIQVQTFYPGASPEVMTTAITAPLERQFGEMPGLSQMSSISSGGASQITLQFALTLSLDVAEQEVQAAINAATSLLPSDLPAPPVYNKVNPADAPILTIALTSATMPLAKVEDLAEVRLAQKLSQQPGVGLVSISGGHRPAVRIAVNLQALSAYGLAIDDIRTIVGTQTTDLPKGSFDGAAQSTTINDNDQLKSAEEYRQLVVAYKNGRPIRLQDIATVADGAENDQLAAWANRVPAVIVNVQRQPGSNVIAVAEGVKRLLPQIESALPNSVDVAILTDRTSTIRASVADVEYELGLAVALVVLVIFLFLRDLPATQIPSLSVPLSLVGTLAVMYLLGFSLDNLSLMALTISTGFVVDDAIVMIENIARHVEDGMAPLAAALRGSQEIGFTIVSLTLSLIAVLIPLLFMSDVVGRLFNEFAVTLAVTIVISACVALTLVPMMCALLLRPPASRRRGHDGHRGARGAAHSDLRAGGIFAWVLRVYERLLNRVLAHQGLTLLVAAGTLAATVAMFVAIPKGFFPDQDTGAIQATTEATQDIAFPAMVAAQQRAADAILEDPAVDSLSSFIGVDGKNTTLNTGRILINLKPQESRGASLATVIGRLRARLNGRPDMTVSLQPIQDLTVDSTVSRTRYHFFLQNPDAAAFAAWVPKLVDALAALPTFASVASDLNENGLGVDFTVDRATASRFGITAATIDNALYDAFGQRIIATLFTQSNQYRVILQANMSALSDIQGALNKIYLPSATATAGQVPLASIIQVSTHRAPLQVEHLGQFPAVSIDFDLAPGASLGAAADSIDAARQSVGLPDTFTIAYQGTLAAFRASLANEYFLVIAALVAVYIVLGILYESFVHPLTILSTLPSAGVGALLALDLWHKELDIVGLIGIILLIGIVKKNAIMMIDFALQAEREDGLEPREAIVQACLLRLRPILMTTFAALFGAIPLMVGTGSGSELRHPLGITIVGGLLVSQVLTLFTTPVVYLAFARLSLGLRGVIDPAAPARPTGR